MARRRRSARVRARVEELAAAWRATRRTAVAVSNEVGSGVVPATCVGAPLPRRAGAAQRRDRLGVRACSSHDRGPGPPPEAVAASRRPPNERTSRPTRGAGNGASNPPPAGGPATNTNCPLGPVPICGPALAGRAVPRAPFKNGPATGLRKSSREPCRRPDRGAGNCASNPPPAGGPGRDSNCPLGPVTPYSPRAGWPRSSPRPFKNGRAPERQLRPHQGRGNCASNPPPAGGPETDSNCPLGPVARYSPARAERAVPRAPMEKRADARASRSRPDRGNPPPAGGPGGRRQPPPGRGKNRKAERSDKVPA